MLWLHQGVKLDQDAICLQSGSSHILHTVEFIADKFEPYLHIMIAVGSDQVDTQSHLGFETCHLEWVLQVASPY